MLEIVHIYCWNKEESKWFIDTLELLYGPYLLLKTVIFESKKFKNITIEQLSSFEQEDLKIKIKYEPMQSYLLPDIKVGKKKSSIDFTYLLELCLKEETVQFSCPNLNAFVKIFIIEHQVKKGFYDEHENSYFLLLKNGKVYELSSCGLFLFGNISLDLNVGFFGACENLLHDHWNKYYFIPWKISKLIKSPFPQLEI